MVDSLFIPVKGGLSDIVENFMRKYHLSKQVLSDILEVDPIMLEEERLKTNQQLQIKIMRLVTVFEQGY